MSHFPNISPKQSFPALESEVLAFWKANDTFKKSIESRPENNPYRFYDGPPFITGTPHYGSLLSSVVKDAVGRYWTMQGKRVDRVWGWDCHGLPIEEKVQKKLGLASNKEIEERGIKEFIDGCYDYTRTTSAEWGWYIDKIGRWVDMDRAYRTMDQDYMESVMWVFKQLWDKGLIYKGKRVSLYSWKLSTPISNFEVAMDDTYQEVNDPAITVRFVLEKNDKFPENTTILAWTTTPWTIPANMALAVGENIEYILVKNNDEHFIVAKNRAETVFKGKGEYEVIQEMTGADLAGLSYVPPFDFYKNKTNNPADHRVYIADFATNTDGTGIVHTAPEFGDVDYLLGKEKGITITEALDDEGKYTAQLGHLAGMHYLDANKANTETMKANGTLFKNESITHRIPFCPRSGTPLVQRAQDSWFIDIQSQKEKLLKANEKINWFPEYLKYGRFAKGIESAPDWCISRTRFWGAPMPIWIGENDEKLVAASREEIFQHNKPFAQLTKIILVRHGRTDYNDAKKQDSLNKANLTDFGKNQAEEIAKLLEKVEIDAIYSSPFNRCLDTISPLSKAKNLEISKVENFQELQKPSWQDTEFKCSDLKWDDAVAGDETLPQAEARIRESLEKIIKENAGKTIVICTHGDPFVLMEKILLDESYESLKKKMPSNKGKVEDFVRTYFAFSDRAQALNLHRPYIDEIKLASPTTGKPMTRIKEVLDVWMDSGSMPYAQMHYPFANKKEMEASFPADFIAEYVGQVRAWFYVMHVLGVLLNPNNETEPTPSFTNVITTGVINGNDGRKMSKSFGNYPDPRATIEKYGADPIRFYMLNSPLLSGGDMDFKEEGIIETIKNVMLPIWNTYSFFTTYANIDHWKKNETEIFFARHGESEANVLGKMSDGTDDPNLTEKGKKQAKAAGETLKNQGINFDVIIHTDRIRTHDTAHIIGEELGYTGEYIVDNGFIEQTAGEYANKTIAEVREMLGLSESEADMVTLRKAYKNNSVENIEQFEKRILAAYENILQKYAGKKILIVAHAGTARPMLKEYHGLDAETVYYNCNIQNADPFRLMTTKICNPLDLWILSKLQILIGKVHDAMHAYDVSRATRAIVDYMGELTNWYVRLSRRRFWGTEMTADKNSAYNTLYTVLVEVSKLLAPFMPFMAESMFQGLTKKESVHLEYVTLPNKYLISSELNRDMELASNFVSLGLSLRSRKNIRVRQPLASVTIPTELSHYYEEIIKNELNVKSVKFENPENLAKKICKPDARKIGPKFGKDVQKIIIAAKNGDFTENADGSIQVGEFRLESGEFTIEYTAMEGVTDIEGGYGTVISMDTNLTEKLLLEGYARDIIRQIQDMRKEANYQVTDQISLHIAAHHNDEGTGNLEISQILEKFGAMITNETLSTLTNRIISPDLGKTFELENGAKVTIQIAK